MRKKWFSSRLAVGLMAVSLVVVAGCSNGDSNGDSKAIATVGKENITQDDLNKKLVDAYGDKMLEAMIDQKIVELELKKEKISVSKDDIEKEYKVFIDEVGGEETFKAALEQQGITEKDFKADLEEYLSIRKLMEPKIKVTEDEIKEFFEENKASLGTAEQVEASHILVEDEKLAKDIAKKIKDGEDFAKLAKEYSEDPGSAANGGELSFFPRGKMVPEFEEAAFAMKKGEISDIVKTKNGYHIIHVTDKKEAKEATLKENEELIKEKLTETKLQSEYPTWLAEAREEYKVENKLTK